MTESNNLPNGKVYSENDTLDINELASLNDDISPEFIEQLQNEVSRTAKNFSNGDITPESDDAELFEEVTPKENELEKKPKEIIQENEENHTVPDIESVKMNIDENLDDNFIKKYKARLNKQQQGATEEEMELPHSKKTEKPEDVDFELQGRSVPKVKEKVDETPKPTESQKEIENLTGGNIIEKPLDQKQINYNDSLDLLDNNVKYSKYVVYIDPENTEFIESLTIKERKNLINRILREQDDIAITKRRLGTIQTIIKHVIIAIITFTIAVPVIYITINASLEATINNQRRSQTLFQTLYKEHGKIKTNR